MIEKTNNTIRLGTDTIVEVKIVDPDWDDRYSHPDGVLDTYLLVNPNREKLAELKKMIESRLDYDLDESLSDEEIKAAEQFCDNIWEHIQKFIDENFICLDVNEVFTINY